jgi:threonine aldolase
MTSHRNFVSGKTHGFQRGVKFGAFVLRGAFSDMVKLLREAHTQRMAELMKELLRGSEQETPACARC